MSKADVAALNKIKDMNYELKMIRSSLRTLRDAQTSICKVISEKVQTSHKDGMGDTIAKIIDMENQYKQRQAEIIMLRQELKNKIDKLNSLFQAILTDHYLNGMTWLEIADVQGYCERHLYTLNKKAMAELEQA